jgi:hypothetical protein
VQVPKGESDSWTVLLITSLEWCEALRMHVCIEFRLVKFQENLLFL